MRKEGNTYHLTPEEARKLMGEKEYFLSKKYPKRPLPPLIAPPFAEVELSPEVAAQIESVLEVLQKEKRERGK